MQHLNMEADQFIKRLAPLYDRSEAEAIWRYVRSSDVAKTRQQQGDSLDTIFKGLLPELQRGVPVQYVLEEAWFMDLKLKVTDSVLIPRPETEELVDLINRHIQRTSSDRPLRILDVGTGSGCIALALKHRWPAADVWAMDISPQAIQIARQNAQLLGLELRFLQADLLEWELVLNHSLKWDIIVSNPPYITPGEKAEMHTNVLDFEPETALFVPEESPLLFYHYLTDLCRAHLAPGGSLYVEINQKYGESLAKLFREKGLVDIQVTKDMQGQDRMLSGKLKI